MWYFRSETASSHSRPQQYLIGRTSLLIAYNNDNLNSKQIGKCYWSSHLTLRWIIRCKVNFPILQMVLYTSVFQPSSFACFRCFSAPTHPDSNDQLVITLCWSLIMTHPFESGLLEQGSIYDMEGRGLKNTVQLSLSYVNYCIFSTCFWEKKCTSSSVCRIFSSFSSALMFRLNIQPCVNDLESSKDKHLSQPCIIFNISHSKLPWRAGFRLFNHLYWHRNHVQTVIPEKLIRPSVATCPNIFCLCCVLHVDC